MSGRGSSTWVGAAAPGAPALVAILALAAVSAVRAADADRPDVQGLDDPVRVPLTGLDFETEDLPAGWAAWDELSRAEGVPDRHAWARDTCEHWGERGGTASAWALRGGVVGEGLPCGGPNVEPVDTVLTFGPFDSRPYVHGIEVELDVKLDLAFEEAFLVCMTAADPDDPLRCFSAGVTETDWASFEPAVHFADGGDQAAAMLYVLFRDRDPEPGHTRFGAYVDNVVVIGLLPPATPTPTPSPTPTPDGSETPGTPGPAETPGPTPSGTTSPTAPTPDGSETPTPDPSGTLTATPAITTTLTATSSPTPSEDPGSTPTATPTADPEATPSASPTLDPTPTPSSAVPTPSPSASPTATRSPTEDPGDGGSRRLYLPMLVDGVP